MMMSQKASQLTNQELRFKISKNTKQVHAVLAVTLRTSEGIYRRLATDEIKVSSVLGTSGMSESAPYRHESGHI